ncbi:MAG: D-alanine--D-alanine ligase family protein [Pyrinomonadaceae bacterium]
MKIALLYNARPAHGVTGETDDAFEEYDSEETIAHIAGALRGLGARVEPVLADRRLPWRLDAGRYDFVFNIAEGQGRRCREAVPAAVCELLGVPFTGSDALTLAVTLDKWVARRVVSPDVPVARGVLVEGGRGEGELASLQYPVLVKPNDEGSSKGIRENPLAADPAAAAERCRWLRAHYRCPVLVEEFLPGAEITVGVVGNDADARVLGMMEIAPASGERPFVYSLEFKRDWRRLVRYHVPPRLDEATLAALERLALAAYRLLGCRDIARMDFRLDAAGRPHFIECNPLPGLNRESGDIVILSRAVLPYENLVRGILLDAARRTGVRLA